MIAFNHAEFIAQAIESVLAQIAPFPFELVIGEDCSNDDTVKIIETLSKNNPQIIRARFNSPNLGMLPNFLMTLSECRGKYVAMLEGDDYWSDTAKIARQVRFLEENHSYAMCFHPVQVLENGKITNHDRFTRPVPETTTIRDLARGNYIHTCSVMYRRESLQDLPENFMQSSVGDYYLHMLSARNGLIGRLPQCMSVYRVHSGGVWSAHRGIEEKILSYLECMIGQFENDVNELLRERHRKISAKNFLKNLSSNDAGERFLRAQRYGFDELIEELRKVVPKPKTHPLKRVLQRLKIR